MAIWRWTRVPVALVTSLGLGCGDRTVIAPDEEALPDPAFYTASADRPLPHVVVLREERAPGSGFLAAVSKLGGRVERSYGAIGVLTVGGLRERAAAALAARSDVQGVSRDLKVQWLPPVEWFLDVSRLGVTALGDQSGASFFNDWQWNIRQISADDAWLMSPQSGGALVCVLDTGVDPGHEDLIGRLDLAKSTSVVAAEPFLEDYHFHGTFVTALVASNGVGMASVAPAARLCAVKVLSQDGKGSFDDVIAGMMHAATVGADVINLSLGAALSRSDPDTRVLVSALQRAVRLAVRQGALVVAGAGNDGLDLDQSDLIFVPAQLNGVLSVGATGPFQQVDFDRLASYTNFGKNSVDLMAPGGEDPAVSGEVLDGILSACSRFIPGCGSGSIYLVGVPGTSVAAPHVAGAAAVVESMLPGDQNGSQLETCLFLGADQPDGQVLSPLYGRGRLNVLRSVQTPGCGLGVVVNPATQLAFTAQPSQTVANNPIAPAVRVTVQKSSDGSTLSSFQGSVTVTIGLNVAGGTLVGTTNRLVLNGVATFDDLTIDKPGTGYTLRATAVSATSPTPGDVTSSPFDIHPEGETTPTGSMSVARRDHKAVLLNNGKVLIVGGTNGVAELYDPGTGAFTTVMPLFGRSQGLTATKLADGRVLIVGGSVGPIPAVIFDPATNTFAETVGDPNVALNYRTGTLLNDGRVLLAGGQDEVGGPLSDDAAEIFDPVYESFTAVGNLNDDRSNHAATLLPGGKVLLAGGSQTTSPGSAICLSSAEIYDPVNKTFSLTGSMAAPRCGLGFTGITLLNDGRVLVFGWAGVSAELYRPATGTFSATGNMNGPRTAGGATLLLDGRVLVTGGSDGSNTTATVELYDPIAGTFMLAVPLAKRRQQHTATRLVDGRVLVAGGFNSAIGADLNSAELYFVSLPPIP